MKRSFIALFLLSFIFAFSINKVQAIDFPEYKGYVNDYENILNNDEELNSLLLNLEKETSAEVVVVTIPNFQNTTIDDYAVKLFEKWGIGKKDVDNGLLIIVSKEQRQSRFEVGYGLEGTLPDALTGRIQDEYMIPQFKNSDYSAGVRDGLVATIGLIKKDPTIISKLETQSSNKFDFTELVVIILVFGIYIMAPTKSWWFGGVLGFIVGIILSISTGIYLFPIILIPIGLFIDFILSKTPLGTIVMHTTNAISSSRSSGGGGGVSFGGGSSGGGGSSRSW